MQLICQRNQVTELTFTAAVDYADPYNEVEVDVVFEGPDGASLRVPAFWAGDGLFKVRFAAPATGEWRFRSEATNHDDPGLNGISGSLLAQPYQGKNRLLSRGRLRVAEDKRHFQHADGTPFFWVGDTWWMGFTTRLAWPQGFRELAADRVRKGFNVIQIIAGPYPDMDAWDPRARNEAGFAFDTDFPRVNPAYYDHADLKLAHLVEAGLMPCIVGMWGYYLPQIGVDRIKRFWRYLVARYGAYPVTWCICGEGIMPYYLSGTRDADVAAQKAGWTEVMRHVRQVDPWHNLITIHPPSAPTVFGRDQVEEPELMDFEIDRKSVV